ncbi:MAG: FecR domain-containing protein [Proteobacteria bacterium]|nr:FecR domain-containing protein [Pseudomonadota bacterium]
MKIVKAVLIAAVLIFVQAYAFSASANPGYMRLSYVEGDAQIMTTGAGQWGLLSINTPIGEGDQIWVPQDGIAELQLNSGSYIRLDGNTSLQILSMDDDSSQFYLSQGSAYVYYDAPQGSVIQLDDPDASTRAFDRAIFRIDVQDQYSDVSCYKGYVETENQLGNTRVNAGQTVSLGRDTNGDIAPLGPPDEWDLWNRGRHDELFPRNVPGAGSYLPSELSPYSSELGRSGRWVRVPDYGYVWTPTVFVGPNWAPYRHGRWIRRGHDYVWLSSEPWGWAPYHYGRWAFAPAIGWFWVPPHHGSVYWGPGYVGWSRTADYVAWVPLAPGEMYYGRGYYGRNSVNITHVDIKRVNITKVYRNVYVNNGATVVRHNNFARGFRDDDHVDMKIIKEKIFIKNHMSPGTPDIKPTKESYFVSDRPVPADKIPPQRIRNVQMKELQQARKFIRERDKSVMRPGKAPKPLPLNTVSTPRTPGKMKNKFQQVMPEQQRRPVVPDNGRVRKEERKPVQVEEQRQPAAPDKSRVRKEERKPVQVEEQRQPAAPDKSRVRKEERKPVQVEEQRHPAAPDKSRVRKEERKPVQVEEQRHPVVPDNGRVRKEERKPVQVEQQRQPAAPDKSRVRKEERKPVQVEQQRQPAAPDKSRVRKEERKPVQVEQQRQPPVVDGERAAKGKKKQGQSGAPECGPGQKDEFNPEKCPQRR